MEKKETIYDAFIKSGGVTLTTKELNALGFTSPMITKLINEKIIKREQRGIYTLDALEDVIDYGHELIRQKRKQEANILFAICYKIEPNNLTVAFQRMNSLVSNSSYKNAYTIFESLCKENFLSKIDEAIFYHLFYYLGIDKEQKESEFLNLEKEHILIKKLKREDNIDSKIKICILNNDFSSAQTLIAHHKENKTIQDKFIEKTVIKLHIMQKRKLAIIKRLIKERKYTEAKTEIDGDSKLVLKDKIAFKKILDDKIVIESGKTIKPAYKNANSFYQAIEIKNYNLVRQFIKEDKRLSMYEELVDVILKGNKENKEIKFSTILDMLMQDNLKSAISLLEKYLEQNKKEQYKDLVIDYIKASILEGDLAYSKPMILLTQLNNNTYFFDLSNVLQDFYKSLSLNNKVLSKIYLDIITDANELGLSNMNIKHLYAAIPNMKEIGIKEELMQKINYINILTNKEVKDNLVNTSIPIFNEELASIFDLIISDQKLTLKTLENLGMSKEKIKNLVEEKVLKKVRRYEYALTSTDQLNSYGKYLTLNKEYDKADKCAMKCFEIEPENVKNIKQAFYSSLKLDDLIRAYEIFGKLKEKELLPKQIQNCCLYLFDLLLPLNDKDKNMLKYLKEEDFYFLDGEETNQDVAFENDIMGFILKGKNIPKAIQLLQQDKSNFNHKVIEQLLHKIMLKNKNQLSLLEELVDKKEYETIFTELTNTNIGNNVFQKRILKVVEDILEVKENKMVSNIKLESSNPIDVAIMQKKYSSALTNLSLIVTDNVKIQKRNGILKSLLTDMIYLMDGKEGQIENEKNVNIEENVVDIDKITMLLNDENISIALEKIDNYLKTINKSEYQYLILDLLKLDILNKNTTFEKTMTELSKLKNNDYIFDIETILPDFYDSLGNKRFLEARVYLDMIINSKEYKKDEDFIQQLKNIVDNAQNNSTYQASYHIHNNFLELFDGLKLSNQIVTMKEPMKANDEKKEYDIVKNILLEESKMLEENDGIVVLSPKYTKYKVLFSKIADELNNIDIYAYGKDKEERILLKRGNTIDENKISHKELFAKANAAYKARNYEKSLEINNFIFESSKEVKPFLLKNIGIVYLKLGKKEKAERLIKIADDMTYAQNLDYHYTSLLDTIVANTMKDGNETKARPNVDVMEFSSNEDNYGIENLEEVSHLISQVKMPVLEACEKLGFDQEKTNIVTLLCARDCFIDKNDELGNKYLKMIEKTNNKTKKVKEIFQEITNNKNFYKNRANIKQLILK